MKTLVQTTLISMMMIAQLMADSPGACINEPIAVEVIAPQVDTLNTTLDHFDNVLFDFDNPVEAVNTLLNNYREKLQAIANNEEHSLLGSYTRAIYDTQLQRYFHQVTNGDRDPEELYLGDWRAVESHHAVIRELNRDCRIIQAMATQANETIGEFIMLGELCDANDDLNQALKRQREIWFATVAPNFITLYGDNIGGEDIHALHYENIYKRFEEQARELQTGEVVRETPVLAEAPPTRVEEPEQGNQAARPFSEALEEAYATPLIWEADQQMANMLYNQILNDLDNVISQEQQTAISLYRDEGNIQEEDLISLQRELVQNQESLYEILAIHSPEELIAEHRRITLNRLGVCGPSTETPRTQQIVFDRSSQLTNEERIESLENVDFQKCRRQDLLYRAYGEYLRSDDFLANHGNNPIVREHRQVNTRLLQRGEQLERENLHSLL